jgi:alkylation response protein AidB-like acyl-CoA dehydrogenase
MASDPEVQHDVAEMAMELEAIGAHIESVARDWYSASIPTRRLAGAERRIGRQA